MVFSCALPSLDWLIPFISCSTPNLTIEHYIELSKFDMIAFQPYTMKQVWHNERSNAD